MHSVLQRATELFEISPDELLGASRRRHISSARQACAYVLHHSFGMSLQSIADVLNREDHSTIVHALHAVEQRMAADPYYAFRVEVLLLEQHIHTGASNA